MDKKKHMILLNRMCKIYKFVSMIALCIFLIPIIMIFEINVYDMGALAILFTLASISNLAYYSSINNITIKCINDTKEKSIDKFQLFDSMTGPTAIDIINIIFLGLVWISYFICLVVADCPILTKILYFLIMIIPSVAIPKCINSYLNNYYELNKIIRKYYDEILSS